MNRIQDLPIGRKLTLVILLTCTAALLLATGSFVTYDITRFRRELVDKTGSLAGVTGHNTAAALEFNDAKSAADTLASLRDEPHVTAAYVYDRTGQIFARFVRAGTTPVSAPTFQPGASHRFADGRLALFRPVVNQGETIGTIAVVSDLAGLSERLTRYAFIVGLVFTASLGLVLLLSIYFERWLTRPLLGLARLARAAAEDKNYSNRAVKVGADEIGQLVDGFNDMLAQIHTRDTELQEAQSLLEKRVEERTADLQLAQQLAAREQARFRFIFESLPVGVVWMIPGQPRTRIVNPSFARITGVPVDAPAPDELYRLGTHPEDLARQEALHAQLLAGVGDGYEIEQRYAHPDGTLRSAVLGVRLFRSAVTGEMQEIRTLVDITERKKAEAERVTLHRQLIDTSRQAGMAEVATGVLHNVGNVLNSVNISAQLMDETLARSQVAYLTNIADLIRSQGDRFAAFVTEDPRGALFPGFVLNLTSALVDEHTVLVSEVQRLSRNIDHIKQIISAQQTSAKQGGMMETLSAEQLFDEAVSIARASLIQHEVEIERHFGPVPPLNVDRHRALQILVNFVTNAIHAVKANAPGQRCITLRLTSSAAAGVIFDVIDNGVGIAPENLTRIFTHGFTTRRDGHGFGLHSGALAAQVLGGQVRVASAGSGQGAAFTLELPATPSPTPLTPDSTAGSESN